MKPEILLCVAFADDQVEIFRRDFEVHYAPNAAELETKLKAAGPRIRGVVTTGSYGLTGEQMRAMPNLEIVVTRGVGVENVDIPTARERGVVVCNFSGGNFFAVADHAMALLLSIVRRVPFDNDGVHKGEWLKHKVLPLRPVVYRKRMGILGLGAIGSAIAQRALGFEMTIGYYNRNRREDAPYRYLGSIPELAAESDILMISAPGGPDTRGLVGKDVIDAIGPSGFLVNVGRGSIVDSKALVDALESGRIAGAAIDVVDGEPEVPDFVLRAPNLVITPHVAGGAPETRYASIAAMCENLSAQFSGQPVKNRVV
jgi:lactate dehydrogenase-like 2-hydroxyacid dehydrogenase